MEGGDREARPALGVMSVDLPRDFPACQASQWAALERNGKNQRKRILQPQAKEEDGFSGKE